MIDIRRDQALSGCVYEPTPTEVRWACKEIQATWSPRERVQRTMVRLSELVAAIDGARAGRLPHAGAAGDEAER